MENPHNIFLEIFKNLSTDHNIQLLNNGLILFQNSLATAIVYVEIKTNIKMRRIIKTNEKLHFQDDFNKDFEEFSKFIKDINDFEDNIRSDFIEIIDNEFISQKIKKSKVNYLESLRINSVAKPFKNSILEIELKENNDDLELEFNSNNWFNNLFFTADFHKKNHHKLGDLILFLKDKLDITDWFSVIQTLIEKSTITLPTTQKFLNSLVFKPHQLIKKLKRDKAPNYKEEIEKLKQSEAKEKALESKTEASATNSSNSNISATSEAETDSVSNIKEKKNRDYVTDMYENIEDYNNLLDMMDSENYTNIPINPVSENTYEQAENLSIDSTSNDLQSLVENDFKQLILDYVIQNSNEIIKFISDRTKLLKMKVKG
jgi:hypothetical protein